ncbi:MAG: DUF2164 domain-containing protein [Planctomycetota bacterium]|jgi:uncharacterized protein (DUF2164 family)
MAITIAPESKQRIFASMQAYCREHLDCDPGLLQTEELYEFFVGLIGATVYNQAVGDTQAWLQQRLLDLEGDLHEQVEYEC